MTKAEFVDKIRGGATKTQLTQAAAAEIVDLVFETMAESIKGDEAFRFPGFGTFTLRKRAARTGRPVAVSRSTTRRPVLPVPPNTNVVPTS